ncbi:ATP-binding protein [Pseudomonas kielensis]|uniref:ATP-binding protein n=1 Tax=Pseudomonas kielensis TaxID=2762577 RepID=UPI002240D157|nr:ATP-binding protein [Pseudomonas kielensis]UZM16221.1 ATP-binding protein [Pseudomonas kielensis]
MQLQLQRIEQQLQTRLHPWRQEPDAMGTSLLFDEEEALPTWLQARLDWLPPSLLNEEAHGSRLAALVQRFGLNSLERDVFLLALLPYVENNYLEWFAHVQGSRHLGHPTVQFALDVLCPLPLEQARQSVCLLPDAPLISHGLIQLANVRDGSAATHGNAMLKLAPSLHHYLMGHDYFPALLSNSCRWLAPPTHLAAALESCRTQLQTSLCQASRLALKGLPGSGRSELVAAAAASLTMRALEWDLTRLPEDDGDASPLLTAVLREVQLHAGCLVIKGLPELAQKRPGLHAQLGRLADGCAQPIVVLHDMVSPVCWLGEAPQKVLTLPTRDLHQDRALLAMHLAGTPLAEEVDLVALAQRFPIVAPRLPAILQEAELYRQQRDPASPLSQMDLHQAFRWRSQQNFGELVQRIEPKRGFDDLIVPMALQQQLSELGAAIRQREHTLALGFGDKLHYGLGISALFHGASGAGKTMAAEVMAATLGVDLIKVDLSTVVNKYIGETEKNLSRIFDLAALDSGVLFFDEADALFGKRSESKDAKDRHANIEVAYLLQRMEAHTGLIILSTNHRSHLDNAFSRRFTFIIKFDYPDHATRALLWQAAWPAQVRLADDVDFDRLAAMADLTGANIRNIVLAATWLAADAGTPCIGMPHIQHALKRELAKTGQLPRQ